MEIFNILYLFILRINQKKTFNQSKLENLWMTHAPTLLKIIRVNCTQIENIYLDCSKTRKLNTHWFDLSPALCLPSKHNVSCFLHGIVTKVGKLETICTYISRLNLNWITKSENSAEFTLISRSISESVHLKYRSMMWHYVCY